MTTATGVACRAERSGTFGAPGCNRIMIDRRIAPAGTDDHDDTARSSAEGAGPPSGVLPVLPFQGCGHARESGHHVHILALPGLRRRMDDWPARRRVLTAFVVVHDLTSDDGSRRDDCDGAPARPDERLRICRGRRSPRRTARARLDTTRRARGESDGHRADGSGRRQSGARARRVTRSKPFSSPVRRT